MAKTLEQLRTELDSKIPRDAISTRDAGQGTKLDYVSSYYVIKRLNEVLGQGNWSYVTKSLALTHAGPFQKKNWKSGQEETQFSAHYLAQVELIVRLDDRTTTFMDVGYGDGTDKTMPGKAHELAAKEAVTDALKRCAKNLGMSLGLALYDKEQENVSEEDETLMAKSEKERVSEQVSKTSTSTKVTEEQGKRLIKQSFEVLNAQRKTNKDKFVEQYLKPHNAAKTDALNEAQVQAVLHNLKVQHPELGL